MRAQWAAVGGHGCAGDGRAQVRSSQVQGSGPPCVSTQELIGDEHDRSKDWKEAFAQHPDVGADVAALARQAPGQRDSLEVERAGLAGASEETVQELARLHGRCMYARRGGCILIPFDKESGDKEGWYQIKILASYYAELVRNTWSSC